ncbi:hypothetical protein MBRA_02594 [Methylobacterium brachiatum]|nr:hypothetical protein MBRA_02594 [Methylobacterium brachiatum]
MRQFPHLKRNHRSGNWVYFRRFPKAAQAATGCIFFERSLRTADRNKIPGAWAIAHQEFEAAVNSSLTAPQGDSAALTQQALHEHPAREAPLPRWDGDLASTLSISNLRMEDITGAIGEWGQRQRFERSQRLLNAPLDKAHKDAFEAECRLVGACGQERSWLIYCPDLHKLTIDLLNSAGIKISTWHASLYLIQLLVENELREVLEAEGRWRKFDFSELPTKPRTTTSNVTLAPNGYQYILLSELV